MHSARPPQVLADPETLDALELLRHGVWDRGSVGPDGPASLEVPATEAADALAAGAVEVVDPEGVPVATVPVRSARPGTGTDDPVVAVASGPPTWLAQRSSRPFERLYRRPVEVRDEAAGDGALPVLLDRPATVGDLAALRDTRGGRPVLVLGLAGSGSPGSVTLLRSARALATALGDTRVVAVPLDPSATADARRAVLEAYTGGAPVHHPGGSPDADEPLVRDPRAGAAPGLVVFFTGLSGSGKSTLARGLRDVLLEQGERTVTLLDGDVVRRNLSEGLSFSPEDRERNIRRIGWVAAEVAHHGGAAICSPIAPFARTRAEVRHTVTGRGGDFVLVHVATPLEECERRDRKGLYARARRGEIADFTGISSPYEVPEDADLRVDTTGRTIADVGDEVHALLRARGLLPAAAAVPAPVGPA